MSAVAGCRETETVWSPVAQDGTIKIAVVGDDEFYTEGGTVEAMALAAGDFYSESGTTVEIVYYDDDADYRKAIAYANEIAADADISAVIIKQEIDYIDTVADIYEAAQKPFIITSGCYNHTIENNYEYLIADFINAKSSGEIMAQYVLDSGFKRAVFCHSDTEYEEDELKGFQSAINNTSAALVDTVIGPYTQEEFDIAYQRWQTLGVDVICVSNYYSLNSDLVRMLREKGSDIQVVSDYVMDTDEDIAKNGAYLDGTVIVPLYVTGENNADIAERYSEAYGTEMLEKAAQSYDVVMMLAKNLTSGVSSAQELMERLKSGEGYDGVRGKVTYGDDGALISSGEDILIYKDGGFRLK
jgi:ABC-type branched-subunit amino acid transport system substrate-binding protein